MLDKKRKFPVTAAIEENHHAHSCDVETCSQTQSMGDNKRFKSDAGEPDFAEDPLEYEDEADLFDVDDPSETVCCICDNGGDVVCCDGPCLRSFHLDKDAGGAEESHCATLGLNKANVERMDLFFCPNCKYKEHQCYICKKLGCSNEAAGDAQEVFLCVSAMCGHFYHAECVAKMLLKDAEKVEQENLIKSIRLGKDFVCPMHKCWKCGRSEEKEIWESQFGVCRRCPRVWHRKCFPKFLRFKEENDKPQRAWEGLLSDRVLIYCIEHKINRKLCTPGRTQAVFPDHSKWAEKNNLEVEKRKRRLVKLHQKEVMKVGLRVEKKPTTNATKTQTEISFSKQEQPAVYEPLDAKFGEVGAVSQKTKTKPTTSHSIAMLKESRMNVGISSIHEKGSLKAGIGLPQDDEVAKKSRQILHVEDLGRTNTFEQRSCQFLAMPQLQVNRVATKPVIVDNKMRSMIRELITKTKCLITLESIHKKHDTPFCYKRNVHNLDKKYSTVKIESIMKGTRKAVETLEGNGNIEDAKTQCAPDCLKFLEGCKHELRIFLAPFLHGARYTPFGRHFTQLDKLKQIVDKVHWYIQNGDTVVDFCCGSNDFSLLMKTKLDQMGKSCYYKNFDIIQSQDSFNFVKKDWFKVTQNELGEGSRLVIGLNPPFGVKGRLATLFIDHALNFRPKILVLVVPKETQRLDRKQTHYDLIWEDPELLKGKSFYLPGSVDIHGKPLTDWNIVPPPLFLWSRPDWSDRHRRIACESGHITQNFESRMNHSVDLNCNVQENKPKHSMQRGRRVLEARGSSDPIISKNMQKKRSHSFDGNHIKVPAEECQQASCTEHFNERRRVRDMRRMQSKHGNHEQHETGIHNVRQDYRDQRNYESGGAYEKPPNREHGVGESLYYNAQLSGGTSWAPGFAPPDIKLGKASKGYVCEGYPIDLGQPARSGEGLAIHPLDLCVMHPKDMAQSMQQFCGMVSGRHSMGMGQPARNVYGTAFEGAPPDMALPPPEVSTYNYGPGGMQYAREVGCKSVALPMPSNHSSIELQQRTDGYQDGDYRIV